MSAYENSHDDGIPRFEPWLGVMAASIVPVLVALYVHSRYLMPLIVATVALFLISLLMLRRQTIRRRLRAPTGKPPNGRSVPRAFEREPLEMEGAEP